MAIVKSKSKTVQKSTKNNPVKKIVAKKPIAKTTKKVIKKPSKAKK